MSNEWGGSHYSLFNIHYSIENLILNSLFTEIMEEAVVDVGDLSSARIALVVENDVVRAHHLVFCRELVAHTLA